MNLYALENPFLLFLQSLHTPCLDFIMVHLSTLGNLGALWLILGLLLLIKKTTRRAGLLLLCSMALGALVGNVLLKNLLMRSRPCWVNPHILLLIPSPKDYSFPSGHALSAFAAATSLFLCYKKAGLAAYLVATMMGFSRLYLYVHYPTDVLAGAVLGLICALLIHRYLPPFLPSLGLETPQP